jgi:hypothetical protein
MRCELASLGDDALTDAHPDMPEIIADPHFTTLGKPSSPWSVLSHQGVVMTPSVKDGVLILELLKTVGTNWHGELRYSPFPVIVGESFTITFTARAKCPFTFSVWLGQQEPPYKSLVSKENHFGEKQMTAQWQTFTHSWKPIANEKKGRLNFVLGQVDNVIEIKNVSLEKRLAG